MEKQDKVRGMMSIGFSVNNCRIDVYKQFVEFCKKECNNNYSFGLKMLMESYKGNVKEIMLFEKIMLLQEQVNQIEISLSGESEEPESGPKTMGSGNKKK